MGLGPLLVPGPGQWGLDLDVTEAIKFWPMRVEGGQGAHG